MTKIIYPAGGWLPPHARFDLQHPDSGRDFVTDWRGTIQAPGDGQCVKVGSDRAFPNGFGPAYPYVRIDTGRFAGHTFYIGHTTTRVRAGQSFKFGDALSVADQGHNFNPGTGPTNGGWVELGEAFNGLPGPSASGHWFDKDLTPLVINRPAAPIQYGAQGLEVLRFTHQLAICGWLPRRYWHFNRKVHGALVLFQRRHRLVPDGIVGEITAVALTHAAEACQRNHRKENP